MSGVRLDPVERAVADVAAGRAVVVVDDEERENEGDLVFAAGKATPELMAFMIRCTSGFVCVADRGRDVGPPHTAADDARTTSERMRTAYTVSVDARDGVTTGISAADRAHTIRVLADSATERLRARPARARPAARATATAGCWPGRVTPRRRSTWPGWPV